MLLNTIVSGSCDLTLQGLDLWEKKQQPLWRKAPQCTVEHKWRPRDPLNQPRSSQFANARGILTECEWLLAGCGYKRRQGLLVKKVSIHGAGCWRWQCSSHTLNYQQSAAPQQSGQGRAGDSKSWGLKGVNAPNGWGHPGTLWGCF